MWTSKGCPKKNGNFYTKALRKVVKKCDEWQLIFCSSFGILVDEIQVSRVTSNSNFWKSRLERENTFYRERCEKSQKKEYDLLHFFTFCCNTLELKKKWFYRKGYQKLHFTKKMHCSCFCCCSSLVRKDFYRESC